MPLDKARQGCIRPDPEQQLLRRPFRIPACMHIRSVSLFGETVQIQAVSVNYANICRIRFLYHDGKQSQIGMGGIYTLNDIFEFIAAGADAFQVGTANFTPSVLAINPN